MKIQLIKGKLQNQDVITVIGKRWFDNKNGNTYHSCKVYVNGDIIGHEPFKYGYEDHYLQTAKILLEKKYELPLKSYEVLTRLRDYDIKLISTVSDVNKKDL